MTSLSTDEEQPLMGARRPGGDVEEDIDASPAGVDSAFRKRVLWACFTLILLLDFGGFLSDAPRTSILEGIICRRYYESIGLGGGGEGGEKRAFGRGLFGWSDGGSVSFFDCTVAPVQSELATVNEMLRTFTYIPGMLVTVPFGIMADRYGRRPVLGLGLLGTLMQDLMAKAVLWRPDLFAPRLIWLSALAQFVGGGEAVASTTMSLIIADVARPSQRANLFLLGGAFALAAEVLATPLVSLLMASSPWLPYCLSSAGIASGLLLMLLILPETLRKGAEGEEGDAADVPEAEAEAETDAGARAGTAPTEAVFTPSESGWRTLLVRFRPLLTRNVIAVVLAYFASSLYRQFAGFLIQYIRQRFHWGYEKTNLLMTVRAVVNLVLFLVLLPALSQSLIGRFHFSPSRKDLWISRVSLALLGSGAVLIAIAPTVVLATAGMSLLALGAGFGSTSRSLATSFVHQDHAGLLYSVLALVQYVGGLIVGPLLTLTFRWGLHLGQAWSGMPFLAVAVLFWLSYVALSFVRL